MKIRNIFPWFSRKHDQQINELSWCHVKQIVRYSQQKVKTNCQVFTTATWAPDQPRRLPWHCKDARSLGETGQWTLWQCWHLMENLWRIYLTFVRENVNNLFAGNDGFHKVPDSWHETSGQSGQDAVGWHCKTHGRRKQNFNQMPNSKFQAMVPLEEQMGREKGTDKIEGGAFSGVNIMK